MHVFTRRGAGYREGRALWLLKAVLPAEWDWQCGDASLGRGTERCAKAICVPGLQILSAWRSLWTASFTAGGRPRNFQGAHCLRPEPGLTGDLLVETSLFRCNQVDSLSLSKYFRRTFCNERLYANRQTNPHHDRRGSSGL
jgi:hypothetical protein